MNPRIGIVVRLKSVSPMNIKPLEPLKSSPAPEADGHSPSPRGEGRGEGEVMNKWKVRPS